MTQIPQWESIWGKGLFRRGPNAFILASVASGFAWYFAKQQIENFNTSQRELIRRVEQDETAENCTYLFIQSKQISTITRQITGIAKKLIWMESSKTEDFWLRETEANRKVTWFSLPSLSTVGSTIRTLRVKSVNNPERLTESSFSI